MDPSPEYIDMCRKATELQEMWEPKEGDWFVLYDEIETIGGYSEDLHPIDYREEFPISKKNCVWLPRIDQYCDIVPMEWGLFAEKCSELCQLKEHGLYKYPTFEKAAIAVVMKNMYRKNWNGEDWITP